MLAGVAAFPTPVQPKSEGCWKEIMAKTITLPSGATVTLRDPKTLLAKDRRKIYELANEQSGLLQTLTMLEATMAIIIESWSLDLILPSINFKSIGELGLNDYDFLMEQATDASKILFGNYSDDKETDSPLDKLGDISLS